MQRFVRMKTLATALTTSLCLLCTSCVTAPRDLRSASDYYEASLGPDVFRIMYRGEDFSNTGQNLDISLLRACRLTKEREFSEFAVLDEDASQPGFAVYCAGLNHYTLTLNRGVIIKCFTSKPKGLFTFHASRLEKILTKKLNLEPPP